MMIIGDGAEISAHDTSFLMPAIRTTARRYIRFCFYKWIQLPKYENRQITSANLEIRAADCKQFHHRQRGGVMNKTKLASFSVNAVKCFFSVGAAQ